MDFTIVFSELAKEAVSEVIKETSIPSENLAEFGKVGREAIKEQIGFGKLTGEYEKQLYSGEKTELFANVESTSELRTHNEFGENPGENEMAESYDVLLEPQISFRGGLSACNAKCITSYCYPVNIAKGIGTKNPNPPNSKIGHF